MARRDPGQVTRERLVQTILSLALALGGCGRSSMDVYQSDPGPDGTAGFFGGAGGAPGDGAVAGGSQSLSGTASLVAGASGSVGWTTGGALATGGASTLAFGGSSAGFATGGTMRTGGLSGTAGRGGLSTAGTTRTGGTTATGGVTGTGGTAGRTVTGGSRVGGTTATRTGGTTGGSRTTGGTTGGSKTTGGTTGGTKTTGGTTGTGGTNATGGGAGGTSGTGLTTSGGVGGGTGGSGGSSAAALLQPLVEAFCTAAKSCCARANYPVANLSDCEAQFPSRLDSYPLVDKGTVSVDQQALAACVTAYKNAATTCTINLVKTACKGVFAGLQVEGQPCGGSNQFGAFECKPVNGSATCYRPQGDVDPRSVGSCVSLPRGKSGDACSMTCQVGKTCIVDMLGGASPFPTVCFEEDGLFCSLAANPTVCKPLLKTGDACKWEGNSCGTGNFCSWPNSTCAPAAKLGESCVDRACTDDLICANNLKCGELPFAADSICKGTPSTP